MTTTVDAKTRKSRVRYQWFPEEGKRCELCSNVIKDGEDRRIVGCRKVDGIIGGWDYCQLFTLGPKETKHVE